MIATFYRDDFANDYVWEYFCDAVGVTEPDKVEILEVKITLSEAHLLEDEEV